MLVSPWRQQCLLFNCLRLYDNHTYSPSLHFPRYPTIMGFRSTTMSQLKYYFYKYLTSYWCCGVNTLKLLSHTLTTKSVIMYSTANTNLFICLAIKRIIYVIKEIYSSLKALQYYNSTMLYYSLYLIFILDYVSIDINRTVTIGIWGLSLKFVSPSLKHYLLKPTAHFISVLKLQSFWSTFSKPNTKFNSATLLLHYGNIVLLHYLNTDYFKTTITQPQ